MLPGALPGQTGTIGPNVPERLPMAAGCSDSAGLTLAAAGWSDYVIVIGEDAGAPHRHAASELSDFLAQTGVNFEVRPVCKGWTAPKIAVGPDAATQLAPDIDLEGLGAARRLADLPTSPVRQADLPTSPVRQAGLPTPFIAVMCGHANTEYCLCGKGCTNVRERN